MPVKSLRLLALLLLLHTSKESFAQSTWYFQSPQPQGNTLNAVSFCDTYHGFAVGKYGSVIHTINGGQSWTTQTSGIAEELTDVQCLDPNTAVAVGKNGRIIWTKDAGGTWWVQPGNTTQDLYSVSFTNSQEGTIVGGHGTLLNTSDGGYNWTIAHPAGGFTWFYGVSFSNTNTGTIVGLDGLILRTTDGGYTWTEQTSGVTEDLNGVSFYDDHFGMAVGSGGIILRTTDGGNNWGVISNITNSDLYDVHVQDPDHITLVGKNKTVILCSDGGNFFTEYHQVGEGDFLGACNGTIVGMDGQIFRTDNWGNVWQEQQTNFERDLRSIAFYDESSGIAVGDHGTLLRTTNGGDEWTLQEYDSPSINGSINDHPKDICWSSAQRAYAVCGYDVYNSGVGFFSDGSILRTNNAGQDWTVLYHDRDKNYYGVSFADNNKGIAVGLTTRWENNQHVFKSAFSLTSDGGNTWNHLYFISIEDKLTDVSYIEDQIVMIGESGRILRSTDNGEDFNTIASGSNRDLHCVSFSDRKHGFIVGDYGTVLKTNNGGITWVKKEIGTTKDLYSVCFYDNENGIICDEDGRLFRTVDGGTTWFRQTIHAGYQIAGVWLQGDDAYAVGENGSIFKNPNSAILYAMENISICEGESYEGWMQTGQYSRYLSSSIGVDSLVETFLVVNPLPEKPAIHQSNDTLYSGAQQGNQWYLNGVPIEGSTGLAHVITSTGEYYVISTNSAGCSSEPSETITILTGTRETGNEHVRIYPNPFLDEFQLAFPTITSGEIRIFDSSAKEVHYQTISQSSNARIFLKNAERGIYYISVQTDQWTYNRMVEKL